MIQKNIQYSADRIYNKNTEAIIVSGKPNMHKAEKCILTNICLIYKDDQILVIDRKKKDWPGLTFPGGHVERNENFNDFVNEKRYIFIKTYVQWERVSILVVLLNSFNCSANSLTFYFYDE